MPHKQTLASHSPSGKPGKLPDRRPSGDTDTIPRHSQPASASTSSTGSLLDSSDASSSPDGHIQSPAGLKSITRMMLVDIPMLWGARIATACGTHQKADKASSSQDESEDREGPDIKTGEKTPDSSSGAHTAARGHRHHQQEDVSDFYSGTLEGDGYTRDRDRHWDAVVDADMLYMRALVDGVHINYV